MTAFENHLASQLRRLRVELDLARTAGDPQLEAELDFEIEGFHRLGRDQRS